MADSEHITRAEAKKLGYKRYFTGEACKNGHISARLTSNGSCLECSREKRAQYYAENPEKALSEQKRRRDRNPEYWRQYRRQRREKLDPGLPERKRLREEDARRQQEAEANGESTYISVLDCGKGHSSKRYTNGKKCVECVSETNRRKHEKKIGDENDIAAYERQRSWERLLRAMSRSARRTRSVFYQQSKSARDAALERGDTFYYSLRACQKGHIGWRRKNGQCERCRVEHASSEERKEYEREYYKKNIKTIRERSRSYREKNRERYRHQALEYQRANKHKVLRNKKAYKHRLRSAQQDGMSGPETRQWEKAQKKVCYWCGIRCSRKYHIDHYFPLSRGGTHTKDNLVISCPRCNQSKLSRDPYEFAQKECQRLL